jgi:hypothetical protein
MGFGSAGYRSMKTQKPIHGGSFPTDNCCPLPPFLEKTSNAMLRPMIKRKRMNRARTVRISKPITILAIRPPYRWFQKNRRIHGNLEICPVWSPTPKSPLFQIYGII